MSSGGRGNKRRRLSTETVRGDPYHVGGRTLVPVSRIISFGKARGTVGARRIGGWGGSVVWVIPVAVIEETGDGERRIPIRDATAAGVRSLLGGGLTIALVLTAVRRLVLWRRRNRAG